VSAKFVKKTERDLGAFGRLRCSLARCPSGLDIARVEEVDSF